MNDSSLKKGREFEERATKFLKKQGYKILARNVRYPFGELDIVAMKGKTLVFVEVKGGNPDFPPRTRVNRAKLKRLELAAYKYIKDFSPKFEESRLDVIEVLSNGEINHLKGVGRW